MPHHIHSLDNTERIGVLGAGLMGRLLAFALARAGRRVCLVDAAGIEGSSDWSGDWARAIAADADSSANIQLRRSAAVAPMAAPIAAAMLAPLAESAITEPNVVRMGLHGLQRWPALVAEIAAVAEQKIFLQQAGTVVVWHRADAGAAEQLHQAMATNAAHIQGLPAPERLGRADLAAIEPALAANFGQGLFLPQEGQLDNRQLLVALGRALDRLGVSVRWGINVATVEAWGVQDVRDCFGQVVDFIVDCRGLGAREDWQGRLRGVRGEVLRVHAPEVDLTRPVRLVHPRYPLYIAPKQQGHFVIGATQIETDDHTAPSVRSTMELLSALYTVHSGFAEARIEEAASGLRPTLSDNLPALRWVGKGAVLCLQINGLFRHGFMIAPAMLDAALELLGGQSTKAQQWEIKIFS